MEHKIEITSECIDSYTNSTDKISLEIESSDIAAMVAKASFSLIPYIGSFLGELAGIAIPNQRMDRFSKYLSIVGKRLESIDRILVQLLLLDNNFISLFEDSCVYAVRAITEKRREYISNIVVTGIESKQIEYEEAKHILHILSQINDVEVIILGSYLHNNWKDGSLYRAKYPEIFKYDNPIESEMGGDKAALFYCYKKHLTGLGLLSQSLELSRANSFSAFQGSASPISGKGYNITPSGKLLLKYVGFEDIIN